MNILSIFISTVEFYFFISLFFFLRIGDEDIFVILKQITCISMSQSIKQITCLPMSHFIKQMSQSIKQKTCLSLSQSMVHRHRFKRPRVKRPRVKRQTVKNATKGKNGRKKYFMSYFRIS